MSELVLDATALSRFALKEPGFRAGYRLDGAAFSLPETAALRMDMNVPGRLVLECRRIDVSERPVDDVVRPRFDSWTFRAKVKDADLPDPKAWVDALRDQGLLVAWRSYGGPAETTVPPNYEGWLLQHLDRIPSTDGGLFFNSASQNGRNFELKVEVMPRPTSRSTPAPESAELLRACGAYVGTFADVTVECGNVVFGATEWVAHLSAPASMMQVGA
jgi:hypothetical protein